MAIVKIQHARQLGYCLKGVKAFIEKRGLDWRKFVEEGLSEEELSGIEDHMMKEAIQLARKDNGQ